MARYRRILNARFETAKGRRRCRHDSKHQIVQGDRCIVIEIPLRGDYSYCMKCAPGLIVRAQQDLADLVALSDALSSTST
jgi:hypothetical protein